MPTRLPARTSAPILVSMSHSADSSSIPSDRFAKVALPVPVTSLFTYEVPEELRAKIAVGSRVEVPFGRRFLSGIVIELAAESDVSRTKPISSLYETFMSPPLIRLTEWIATYYGCSLGEAAQSVLPPLLKRAGQRQVTEGVVTIEEGVSGTDADKVLGRARRQRELATKLIEAGGVVDYAVVVGEWGFTTAHVKGLVAKGVATIQAVHRVSPLERMEPEVEHLTPDQRQALGVIDENLETGVFSPVLLQGVTGSGKTELYLRAARTVVESGGGVIVLVPEIGLLPQATVRYRRAFGDNIAILHSRLTGNERFRIWERVERGECRIVLGPRSAVFSPVRNLRLIVVDEEQDDSYKQDDKPRYHARSVALMRGKFENATVLLGSATPSAESLNHARGGLYRYAALPNRIKGTELPEVRLVDMRTAELEGAFFSSFLLERIDKYLGDKRQIILFLNKRGHARYVQCSACGWVAGCKNCDISLTYHRVRNRLKCHFCGYDRAAVQRCGECGSPRLRFGGAGTQRVELELQTLFPDVRILRMDADTTAGKDGHRNILEKFSSGDYRVLIGTQMVTKGHHFPDVDLVGVLFGEESLHYPDFRSSERTFRQLVQVSGRAGRDSTQGEVVVQTYMPEHHVFTHLQRHDYDGFMTEELKVRRDLNYPPFSRVVLASCSSTNQAALSEVVRAWAQRMQSLVSGKPITVLGPVPPVVARVKNRFREHVLIRGLITNKDKIRMLEAFSETVVKARRGRTVDLRWDVDPEAFQ